MANAAIVGFLPGHRTVLFSDSLLAGLPPRELAAVFAHEIGHARRHHVLVFGAWTLVFFLAGDLEYFVVVTVISFYANYATAHCGIAPAAASTPMSAKATYSTWNPPVAS